MPDPSVEYADAVKVYEKLKSDLTALGRKLTTIGKALAENPDAVRFAETYAISVDLSRAIDEPVHVERFEWKSYEEMTDLLNRYYMAEQDKRAKWNVLPEEDRNLAGTRG